MEMENLKNQLEKIKNENIELENQKKFRNTKNNG